MSDHPTVTAAAQALYAAQDGWTYVSHGMGARLAVTAAFRERAAHVTETCENKTTPSRFPLLHRRSDPCVICQGLADNLSDWADEIEASRSAGPTEEISNE